MTTARFPVRFDSTASTLGSRTGDEVLERRLARETEHDRAAAAEREHALEREAEFERQFLEHPAHDEHPAEDIAEMVEHLTKEINNCDPLRRRARRLRQNATM